MFYSNEAELLVERLGEPYRKLIEGYLQFLDEHEPTWELEIPIDREWSLQMLIEKTRPKAGFSR